MPTCECRDPRHDGYPCKNRPISTGKSPKLCYSCSRKCKGNDE